MNKTIPPKIMLLIILAIIAVRATIAYTVPAFTSEPVESPTITKAMYLDAVRSSAPDMPDLAVCIYSEYIDRHGVEATIAVDTEYSDPEAVMPPALQKEFSDLALQCLDR